MNNFNFWNPTKIFFGKGAIKEITRKLDKTNKILLTFGGGSVKNNGVYDDVTKTLEDYETYEFWGIESNPDVGTLRKCVDFAREKNIDFIIAVGGGSVIDGSKLISCAIRDSRDCWDIVLKGKAENISHVPLAAVLTLPATGSEMNRGAVISNHETKEKFSFTANYPVFSVLDPSYTYSLPQYQLACGIIDSFVHVFEQYMTYTKENPLMDRWSEGILLTLIENAHDIISKKDDYQSRANFMLSATMALNGFVAMGVAQDWATHRIGHEITALTGLTHGHTLAIVYPALMKELKNGHKKAKFIQYAERIWSIGKETSDEEKIDIAIQRTVNFFESLGITTTFRTSGIEEGIKKEIVDRFKSRGTKLGENMDIDFHIVEKILKHC